MARHKSTASTENVEAQGTFIEPEETTENKEIITDKKNPVENEAENKPAKEVKHADDDLILISCIEQAGKKVNIAKDVSVVFDKNGKAEIAYKYVERLLTIPSYSLA